MVGSNLGKCEWVWEEILRWLNTSCGIQVGRIQDGCHHQVDLEWMREVFFVQNGWIQDGRNQDGFHHQFEWEWRSLSQIELVWVRVLCKMAESKMTEFKTAEFKMAAIIKLSQNEWVKFFLCKWWEPILVMWFSFRGKIKMAESKLWNSSWQNSRWLSSSS